MTSRIITALAFSLSLGTAAIAQTATIEADTELRATAGMPAGWDGEIGAAFFEDENLGILRTESDIRANFEELTIEQQAMVRSHCAQVDTAAADFDTEIDTGADAEMAQDLDLDDDTGETTADLGAEAETEIETGALDTEAETSLDSEIETGAAAPGTTPELDDEFDTGDAGIDMDIETGAATPGTDDEFEAEAEFTQDIDTMPGDGTMDAQMQASIEQVCAWIDE